jgi:hypothetical protein
MALALPPRRQAMFFRKCSTTTPTFCEMFQSCRRTQRMMLLRASLLSTVVSSYSLPPVASLKASL